MWEVILVEEVADWFITIAETDTDTSDAVTAAIDRLASEGPTLGRPTADRVKASTQHNMKELRPAGTSIRILFIFDPDRQAVLLTAGDKAGNWNHWYTENIPIAESRYTNWLAGNSKENR